MTWDTCVVHTQALLAFKTCFSHPHSPAPVLGVCTPMSPDQRPSTCSPPLLRLQRPGALGVHLCSLPFCIRGDSYRALSQWALEPYSQALPPSCSVRSWSAWQVPLGRRPHGSSRDRALPSRRRCLDWTRMPAPGRVSSQQATEQPHGASDSPCPLPSVGLLSVTPAALCSTKRKS